jgi:hypothetical protein
LFWVTTDRGRETTWLAVVVDKDRVVLGHNGQGKGDDMARGGG